MKRLGSVLALLLVLSGIVIISPHPVNAQNDGPAIGAAVPFVDAEGVARGAITVAEVVDPFLDFNPDYPPEPGNRAVAVIVAFDADAGDRLDVTPYAVVIQDSDGFLWTPGSVLFSDDMLIPELTSQTLAPGSRITGVVGFLLPEGAVPARVLFQPESSRIITLAELTDVAPPLPGDAVNLVDSYGGAGDVTVTDLVDPFTEFDPAYPPAAGTRFVALTLVYANSGDGRFDIEPYGLLLRDDTGTLWSTTYTSRPIESIVIPDLSGDQLAPGDRRSGLVLFALPDGVNPAGLYFRTYEGQLLQLADLDGASAAQSQTTQTTTTVATTAATPVVADETPEPAVVDNAASNDPCLVLDAWLSATRERFAQASLLSFQDPTQEDPAALAEDVVALRALADEQFAAPPPVGAEAVNKTLVATLRSLAGSLEQFGSARGGASDEAAIDEALATFSGAGNRLADIDDQLESLATGCGLG